MQASSERERNRERETERERQRDSEKREKRKFCVWKRGLGCIFLKYASLFRKGEKWRERQRESDSDSNTTKLINFFPLSLASAQSWPRICVRKTSAHAREGACEAGD